MSIDQQIGELAAAYFRQHGAETSEADYLVDIIYGALSTVEEVQGKQPQ